MSKRHDKVPTEEAERELTRKEQLLRHRDRERHKKLYIFIFSALGLALALVLIGVVYQFLVVPNQAAAKVGDVSISTEQFWKRAKFDKSSLQGQLARYEQLEQQFGGQGYFTTQINQLQATLASPYSLGQQTLDNMIQDVLVAQEAAKRGISVSDAEVDAALREEVANNQGLVTAPQATATAEAGVKATATAAGWTPTPVPTVDANAPLTATAAATPTEPPPAAIITDTAYTDGIAQLEKSLQAVSGMSLADYRQIVRARLLKDKLSAVIGKEKVTDTEEAVHARHILLRITDTSTNTVTSTVPAAATAPVTTTAPVTASTAVSATTPVTTSAAVTKTAAVATTTGVTKTAAVTSTASVTKTANVTATTPVTSSASVTATSELSATAPVSATGVSATAPVSPTLRNDAQTLALAQELRTRILAGEDFAKLAEQYSDDTGSAAKGGDLGWFAKGAMVKAFEDAAFSLPLNQVSEPVKSDFGYHLIEVLEKDPNHPKDEATLTQQRSQAFQDWLQAQMTGSQIQRSGDLNSILPTGL